jgi:DNA-3-methyladenine glycosylase I
MKGHRDEPGVTIGVDGKARCFWCADQEDYVAYHDTEWGFPVADDRQLFEKLCLEGFQSGLSWLTILRKREAFRRSFAGFDFDKVARFGSRHVERMLGNAAIVRHKGKIESVIGNARRARLLVDEFGSIASYAWRFEPDPATRPRLASTSPESVALSKDLKKRGWTFVGPTTIHAFMQAMGLVNDHARGCTARPRAEQARRAFRRP